MRKARMIRMAVVAAFLIPGMLLAGTAGACAGAIPAATPHQCCRTPGEPGQSGHCGTVVVQSHPCSCSHLPAAPADEAAAPAAPAAQVKAEATTTAAAAPVRPGLERPLFPGGLVLAHGNPPPLHLIECSFLL